MMQTPTFTSWLGLINTLLANVNSAYVLLYWSNKVCTLPEWMLSVWIIWSYIESLFSAHPNQYSFNGKQAQGWNLFCFFFVFVFFQSLFMVFVSNWLLISKQATQRTLSEYSTRSHLDGLYTACMKTRSNIRVHLGKHKTLKMPSHTVIAAGESCQPQASLEEKAL